MNNITVIKENMEINKLKIYNNDDLNGLIIQLKHNINTNIFDNFLNDSLFMKNHQDINNIKKEQINKMDIYDNILKKQIEEHQDMYFENFQRFNSRK